MRLDGTRLFDTFILLQVMLPVMTHPHHYWQMTNLQPLRPHTIITQHLCHWSVLHLPLVYDITPHTLTRLSEHSTTTCHILSSELSILDTLPHTNLLLLLSMLAEPAMTSHQAYTTRTLLHLQHWVQLKVCLGRVSQEWPSWCPNHSHKKKRSPTLS